jgi:hypothetical protein
MVLLRPIVAISCCTWVVSKLNLLHDLFNALTLPSLRVRHVQGQWPHEELKAFLARSNCPLECLVLGVEVATTAKQRAE